MAVVKTSDESRTLDKSDTMVLSPNALRVGMYVDLNCSWFKHPFPRRTFKLTSESQIVTIKGLGLNTVLVYPRESDLEIDAEGSTVEEAPAATTAPETEADTVLEEAAAAKQTPPTDEELPTHGDYHQAVELASETYRQLLGTSSQMMKDLSTGSEEGMRSSESMISGLSTLLTNT